MVWRRAQNAPVCRPTSASSSITFSSQQNPCKQHRQSPEIKITHWSLLDPFSPKIPRFEEILPVIFLRRKNRLTDLFWNLEAGLHVILNVTFNQSQQTGSSELVIHSCVRFSYIWLPTTVFSSLFLVSSPQGLQTCAPASAFSSSGKCPHSW